MSEAGDFIDSALQYESSWQRAEEHAAAIGDGLEYYGASVGAIRGTLRDASRRYPALAHDDVTALSSELWSRPVYESRLAAIVLLQSNVAILRHTDLTRIEGFLRTAVAPALVDTLARDVVAPLLAALDATPASRAHAVLDRWSAGTDPELRRAAELVRNAS